MWLIMKTALFYLFLFSSTLAFSQSKYSPKFFNAFGFGSSGSDRSLDVTIGQNGDIYCGGFFSNTVNFNPNGNAVFLNSTSGTSGYVARYNQANALQWAVSFSSNIGRVTVRNIDTDPQGNVYATGRFNGTVDFDPSPSNFNLSSNGSDDIFLLKLNPQGVLLWAVSFGGSSDDLGIDVKFNPLGAVMVSGYFKGTVDFDPGVASQVVNGISSENIFMSCFDLNGNFLWHNAIPSSSFQSSTARAFHIALDNTNNFLVSGTFYGSIDLDPSTSTASITSQGGEDAFFAAYSVNGTYLWSNHFGGSGNTRATTIEMGPDQNLLVSGFFTGTTDFDPSSTSLSKTSQGSRDIFISKFNQSTGLLWNVVAGGASSEASTKMLVDQDNKVYAVGYGYSIFDADPDPQDSLMIGSGTSNGDGFLWALDSAGALVTAYYLGSSGEETSQSIAMDQKKDIYLTGAFSSTVDFDPGLGASNLSSNGGTDCYIQKVALCKETNDSINAYGCQFYVSPSGKFYNTNGNYIDTLTNLAGCDSLIYINLQLNQLSNQVTANDPVLYADSNQNVSYQWLDCNNAYATIPGATQPIFTAVQNGSYAVEVSQGACKDTSTCYSIFTIGLEEPNAGLETAVHIFPNPSAGTFNFLSNAQNKVESIRVFGLKGQGIQEINSINENSVVLDLPAEGGVYFVSITLQNGQRITKKLVKL